jgi:hypothetical protein
LWSVFSGDTSATPAQNGPILASRLRYLARVYPRATAGQLLSFAYDPLTATFTMRATSSFRVVPGDRSAETEIYIPPLVRGQVTVDGAAMLDTVVTNPDGSRIAYVATTGGGAYGVDLN